MENFIIAIVIVLIVAGIIFYLARAKKRGQKCIGCPYSKRCNGGCGGNKGCGFKENDIKK
ncbi:MAG: FeoB-associated Cys-rich membrane protein [Acutalibacteraceae bacterium]|nr:FeoB-associated Cys-rich membrane protein [Acutalibacteraceae bacterium]